MNKQKLKKILGLAAIFLASSSLSYAQGYKVQYLSEDNHFINDNLNFTDSSGWFKVKEGVELSSRNFWLNYKSNFGMGSNDDFILTNSVFDNMPYIPIEKRQTHDKYNQTYKGVPVEYAEFILHHKDGNVVSLNGKLAENLSMSVVPTISETDALQIVFNKLGNGIEYTWENSDYLEEYREIMEDANASTYPVGELIIAKRTVSDDYSNTEFVLAWKFTISAVDPDFDIDVYIDANSGTYIKEYDNYEYSENSTAKLMYGYNNNASLDTRKKNNGKYSLRANDSGQPKIYTRKRWALGINKDITNSSSSWNSNHQEGTTAHWVATQAWKYFKDTHAVNGVKGNGKEVRVIYLDKESKKTKIKVNERKIKLYKHPDSKKFLGTRDVIGHEFTHGVIRKYVNFAAKGEPNSLSEGIADIFGFEVERYCNNGNQVSWKLGEDAGVTIRRADNPHLTENPKKYQGSYWYLNMNDYGHHNSTVVSHWFYLLSVGEDGDVNSYTSSPLILGLGQDKAAKITFKTLSYLESNSSFYDFKNAVLEATEYYYGICSNEYTQVNNALIRIDLSSGLTPIFPLEIEYAGIRILPSGQDLPTYHEIVVSKGHDKNYQWTYPNQWDCTENGYVLKINNFNSFYGLTEVTVTDNCMSETVPFLFMKNPIFIPQNPVDAVFMATMNFPEDNMENSYLITIMDASGNMLYEENRKSRNFTLDVQNYKTGNYYINVYYEGQQYSEKFLKL